jgi:hypothetical protein
MRMSPTAEALYRSALQLSFDDRAELTEALRAADHPPCPPLTGAVYLAEIQRRSAAVDAGEEILIPWEEVRRQVREELGLPADG